MKKMSALLLVAAGLTMSAATFAADANGYYSAQHPKMNLTATAANFAPATAITIVNGSQDMIYAVVQDQYGKDLLTDSVYQEKHDHIRHDTNYGTTRLVLRDPNRNTFFDVNVCRRAVVSVFGRSGSFRYNIDEEYCK